LSFKNADEFLTDNLPFLLRIGNVLQSTHKIFNGIHRDQFHARCILKSLHYLRRFSQPEQSIVYKHSHQLISHSPVNQGSCHARINPSANSR
jgi:hypothetical protein